MEPQYRTTREVSSILGIDVRQVRAMCRRGLLPGAHKHPKSGIWLVPADSVSALEPSPSSSAENPVAPSSQGTGDITIGDVSASTMAVGTGARVDITKGSHNVQIDRLFERIYEQIESRPEDGDVDKGEIVDTVQKIQIESVKSDRVNVNKVERWLKTLSLMAPDIWDVTVASLTNPISGVATVVRKVAQRARLEAEHRPDE